MNSMFLSGDDSGYISSDSESIESTCSDASSNFVSVASERKLEIVFEVSDLIVVQEEYNNKNSSVIAVRDFAESCYSHCSGSQGSNTSHTFTESQGCQQYCGKGPGKNKDDSAGNCNSNYEYQQMSDLRPMKYLSPPSHDFEESVDTERIELELVVQNNANFLRSDKPQERSSFSSNKNSTSVPPTDYNDNTCVSKFIKFQGRNFYNNDKVSNHSGYIRTSSNEEIKEKYILRSDSYEESDNSGYVSSISSSSDLSEDDESTTTSHDEELSSTRFHKTHTMETISNSSTRANPSIRRSRNRAEQHGSEISNRIKHLMIDKTNSFKLCPRKVSSLKKSLDRVAKTDIDVDESGYISPVESSSEGSSSESDAMEKRKFSRNVPSYNSPAYDDSGYFSSASDEDGTTLLQANVINKRHGGMFSRKKEICGDKTSKHIHADTSYISPASDEENYFNENFS